MPCCPHRLGGACGRYGQHTEALGQRYSRATAGPRPISASTASCLDASSKFRVAAVSWTPIPTPQPGRRCSSVMRAEGIAPPVIMRGADFHVEASAGTSVMKDFFHFDEDLAPPAAMAGLLAKLHALPVDWYDALKDTFLQRDPAIAAMLKDAPDYAPCWCLPWTGLIPACRYPVESQR